MTGTTAVKDARSTVSQLRALGTASTEPMRNLRFVLEDIDDRDRAVEPNRLSPTGQGFTGLEALLQYFFVQSQAINIYDSKGFILKLNLLLNECTQYTNAQTAVEEPERTKNCRSWLGPNQPGVTTGAVSRTTKDKPAPAPGTAGDKPAETPAAPPPAPADQGPARRRHRHRRRLAAARSQGSARQAPARPARPAQPAAAQERLPVDVRRGRAQPPRLSAGAMRGRRPPSVASNPVFVGAVTVLVVVAAVLLAYQANQGLPFVPAFEIKVDTPDAARLVVGNEVREGGFRIGQVTRIEPVRTGGAQLTLKLDTSAVPIPRDSTIRIRPRSALGLKYVDMLRGTSGTALQEGEVIATRAGAVGPELDDFFSIFDEPTRKNVERNLDYFGSGVAGRGEALNRTLGGLPALLDDLPPVMRTLANPDTRLVRLLDETGDVTRVLAPESGTLARGFTEMADTFEALSRDPRALRETIERSPGTLQVGIDSLPDTRPLLARLAAISDEVQGTAREVRRSVPAINDALAAGTPVLRRLPAFTSDLEGSLRALRDLSRSPTTDITLGGLTDTMRTLNPTLQWAGPHVTVCNYFNYFWTFLADHISDEDATGTVQRVQVKMAPLEQEHGMASVGAQEPANGGEIDPVQHALFGDAAALHDHNSGAAVTGSGEADCESGQRGYPSASPAASPRSTTSPSTPARRAPRARRSRAAPACPRVSRSPPSRPASRHRCCRETSADPAPSPSASP